MSILGEVNKKFIVSPDIDTLLTALEQAESSTLPREEGLMDE